MLTLLCAWVCLLLGGGVWEPPGEGTRADNNNRTNIAAVDLVCLIILNPPAQF
jgi:hypothetical protein